MDEASDFACARNGGSFEASSSRMESEASTRFNMKFLL